MPLPARELAFLLRPLLAPRDRRCFAEIRVHAIQLHDHPETIPALMAGFGRFIAEHPDPNDYRGKLLIVEPHRIRIRS
jgi:hypothetical protein